jgi:hypothetical protein
LVPPIETGTRLFKQNEDPFAMSNGLMMARQQQLEAMCGMPRQFQPQYGDS